MRTRCNCPDVSCLFQNNLYLVRPIILKVLMNLPPVKSDLSSMLFFIFLFWNWWRIANALSSCYYLVADLCIFKKFLVWIALTSCFMQIFRIFMGINVRVLFVLLLLGLGAVFYVGARTSPILVFVFSVCIISFLLSVYLTKWVLAKDEGPPEMAQVHFSIYFY